MSLFRAILFPLLLPVALAAVGRVKERDGTTCSDVHLFLARGNGEAYPGRVGALSNTVCNGLPSCDSENIEFDSDQAYCAQASDGVSSGHSQIAAYASACPNSKLVLGGYSLGAQIVGDILGGGGGTFYGCPESTSSGMSADTNPGSKISAVLLFGDVRHVANEPYNVGPGSGDNGQYPRSGSSLSNLNEYSSVLQSYCLATDPICALGDDGESHTTYMTIYADSAGAWVQQILGYAPGSSPSSGAASSSTTTPETTAAATSTTSSTEFSAPSTTTSSSLQSAAASTSSSVTTSMSAQASTTSSVEDTSSTSSVNTSTFSPFEFSNTATVATTSTYTPTSPTSALSFTATATTKTMISTSSHTIATSSSSSQLPASTASKGGAYSNSAQLTLNLVTLIVIKVLAF